VSDSVEDWEILLGDVVVVTPLPDRLMHYGHLLEIGGRSWRLKQVAARQSVNVIAQGLAPGCPPPARPCSLQTTEPAARGNNRTGLGRVPNDYRFRLPSAIRPNKDRLSRCHG